MLASHFMCVRRLRRPVCTGLTDCGARLGLGRLAGLPEHLAGQRAGSFHV